MKGHAPVRDDDETQHVPDNKSAPGVLHAPTNDRLRFKKDVKDHRSKLLPTTTLDT